MKIALIGATGKVGSRILSEALRRGHSVSALVRDPAKVVARQSLGVTQCDVLDQKGLAAAIAGHDVLVSSFNAKRGAPDYRDVLLKGYEAIFGAAKSAGVRLVIVGGAGSLEVAPGKLLMDAPAFPKEYKTEAAGMGEVLKLVRAESELNWTFLSPAAILAAGERTGKYREGGDQLVADASGQSRISMEDFAVALVDELERPRHAGRRFTVAY